MTKASILIVDDEASVLGVLAQMVELMGHAPTTCSTVAEARRELETQDWDVGFFDILLRQDNGLDLLREVHEDRPDLPIVIMSGVATPERLEEAREAGASGFLLKPFSASEVQSELRQALLRGTLAKQRKLLEDALRCAGQSQRESPES